MGKRAVIVRATQLFFLFFLFCCLLCFRVAIPPAGEACSFTTDGYDIFNVRTNLGACRAHEIGGGGSGTNKSAQELTGSNCPSPCPDRRSNRGSSDLNFDSVVTQLRPSLSVSKPCSTPASEAACLDVTDVFYSYH